MKPEEVRTLIQRGAKGDWAKIWTRETCETMWNDIYGTGNVALLDEILAPGFVRHQPAEPDLKDLESFKQSVLNERESFDDIRMTFEDIFSIGNKYAVRWTWSFTPKGAPPSQRVTLTGMSIGTWGPDGKHTEEWVEQNQLGIMQDLGFTLAPAAEAQKVKDLKAKPRWLTEQVWNLRHPEAVYEYCAPSVISHISGFPDFIGVEAYHQRVVNDLRDYPDVHIDLDEVIGEGDTVVTHWTWRGTYSGPDKTPQPPHTGKHVVASGSYIAHFVDGKCVEDWYTFDMQDWLQQIGLLPMPEQATT
jgi:predicted ester cyclase